MTIQDPHSRLPQDPRTDDQIAADCLRLNPTFRGTRSVNAEGTVRLTVSSIDVDVDGTERTWRIDHQRVPAHLAASHWRGMLEAAWRHIDAMSKRSA